MDHLLHIFKKIAIKVLSLTCSASGCERNWSTFEQIHSKKRSKLDHQKLQDLVFVKYNQVLKEQFDSRHVIDPILLNDIDDSNECLVGDMGGDGEAAEDELVFYDDTLTRAAVANVIGAGEPTTHTRQQTRLKKKATSRKGKEIIQDEQEEEADDVETEEEEEEIYNSSSGESDNDEESLEDVGEDDSSETKSD